MATAESAPTETGDMARNIRDLVRGLDRATLATALPAQGGNWPYASLVIVALDHDLSPILLISELAEHTRALKSDDRVSLLFDGTAGLAQPLTGPRVTLLGRAAASDDERVRRRFLARHPDAALYAGFRDFRFYRVAVERAHIVAGFGRIAWVEGPALGAGSPDALVEAEADIVEHMNGDHADAVALYAAKLLNLPGEGWRMTGIDSEGIDLRAGGSVARLALPGPVANAEQARMALVSLVKQARAA